MVAMAATRLSPYQPLAMASAGHALSLLFYDDRFNETRDRPSLPIYKSIDRQHLPWFVGPSSAANGTGKAAHRRVAGRSGDGAGKGAAYRPGNKVMWIMEALQHLKSQFVFVLDTDAIWLCSAAEIVKKRAKLLRHSNATENSVIVFGERGMWPPYQYYRGINLRLNQTAGFPYPGSSGYFRYLNAGAALGRPEDLLAMYQCMAERYEEFPHACPAGHSRNGTVLYYRERDDYRQPKVDPKYYANQQRYRGMLLHGNNWGWEQACFHHYYLEQLHGELPARCPRLVLDNVAHCLLHLAGVSDLKKNLRWSSRSEDGNVIKAPRVTLRATGESPCVIHANGPSKRALKPIWKWWIGQAKRTPEL